MSIVGHVTRDELRRELTTTDMANGFANRFPWVCTTRSKELPEGGNLTDENLRPLVEEAPESGRVCPKNWQDGAMKDIKTIVGSNVPRIDSRHSRFAGTITSRAAPQTMRLACLYALLDHSDVVKEEHLLAAVAL